jgi:hypothetical protein
MASYSVSLSKHATLVASTVDTVTLTTDRRTVEVAVRAPAASSAGIYFTVDGSTPTAGGDNTFWVAGIAGASLRVPSLSTDAVKLISATADAYSVTGVDE